VEKWKKNEEIEMEATTTQGRRHRSNRELGLGVLGCIYMGNF